MLKTRLHGRQLVNMKPTDCDALLVGNMRNRRCAGDYRTGKCGVHVTGNVSIDIGQRVDGLHPQQAVHLNLQPRFFQSSRMIAVSGCSLGSQMPVTGVQWWLSLRCTSRTSCAVPSPPPPSPLRSITPVTPGSHSSSCPIFFLRLRMNCGVPMLTIIAFRSGLTYGI